MLFFFSLSHVESGGVLISHPVILFLGWLFYEIFFDD